MVTSSLTQQPQRFLLICLIFVSLSYAHPGVCGVAERWGCGSGGACRVPGWGRGCIPKCSGRTVSCGRPVGRRNWWRAKRCHCASSVTQCRMKCRRLKRRRCNWKRRVRYRYNPQWRRYRAHANRKFRSFLNRHTGAGKDKADDDHHHGNGSSHQHKNGNSSIWRWYKKPHWQRYYAWVPVCRKQKFTKCFCPSNPCRCDRIKPSTKPTPSIAPTPQVTPSASPSVSPIFTTVAASPIQPAPDTVFDPNAPLDLP